MLRVASVPGSHIYVRHLSAPHHNRFDVFHVHFGFDAIGPEILEEVVHELEVHRKPLV